MNKKTVLIFVFSLISSIGFAQNNLGIDGKAIDAAARKAVGGYFHSPAMRELCRVTGIKFEKLEEEKLTTMKWREGNNYHKIELSDEPINIKIELETRFDYLAYMVKSISFSIYFKSFAGEIIMDGGLEGLEIEDVLFYEKLVEKGVPENLQRLSRDDSDYGKYNFAINYTHPQFGTPAKVGLLYGKPYETIRVLGQKVKKKDSHLGNIVYRIMSDPPIGKVFVASFADSILSAINNSTHPALMAVENRKVFADTILARIARGEHGYNNELHFYHPTFAYEKEKLQVSDKEERKLNLEDIHKKKWFDETLVSKIRYVFSGSHLYGLPHGRGKLEYYGDIYEGEFVFGYLHGEVVHTKKKYGSANDVFKEQYAFGKPAGTKLLKQEGLVKWEGLSIDGQQFIDGKVMGTHRNGAVITATYQNGNRTRVERIQYPDGKYLEGKDCENIDENYLPHLRTRLFYGENAPPVGNGKATVIKGYFQHGKTLADSSYSIFASGLHYTGKVDDKMRPHCPTAEKGYIVFPKSDEWKRSRGYVHYNAGRPVSGRLVYKDMYDKAYNLRVSSYEGALDPYLLPNGKGAWTYERGKWEGIFSSGYKTAKGELLLSDGEAEGIVQDVAYLNSFLRAFAAEHNASMSDLKKVESYNGAASIELKRADVVGVKEIHFLVFDKSRSSYKNVYTKNDHINVTVAVPLAGYTKRTALKYPYNVSKDENKSIKTAYFSVPANKVITSDKGEIYLSIKSDTSPIRVYYLFEK